MAINRKKLIFNNPRSIIKPGKVPDPKHFIDTHYTFGKEKVKRAPQ